MLGWYYYTVPFWAQKSLRYWYETTRDFTKKDIKAVLIPTLVVELQLCKFKEHVVVTRNTDYSTQPCIPTIAEVFLAFMFILNSHDNPTRVS